MKKCPYCAEEIQEEAIVCRYCGRDLIQPAETPRPIIQQAPSPTKKSSFWNDSKLGRTIVFFLGLCLLFICAVPVMRLLGGPAKQVQPTETAGFKSSVVISTFTAVASLTPAPTETPRPSATPNIGMIGEARESGGIALTVLDVTYRDRLDFLTPDPGNTFLVIDVSIQNVSRAEEAPYNPLYFSVKASSGYEYNASLFSPDPSLKSGKLPMGDKVRGLVAFEIDSGAKGLVVSYEPLVLLGGFKPIRISLDTVKASGNNADTPARGPCEGCNFECPEKQGEFEFCIVDPELIIDKNLLESTVHEYCNAKGTGFCKFLIWTDLTYLPKSLPLTDLQLNNQAADYTRNITTGNDCLKLLSGGSVLYSSKGCK